MPPSHMQFSTLLRPSKPQDRDTPSELHERFMCGLTVVKPGRAKQGSQPRFPSSPMASQKRQIPRNPRQVPSSKLKARSPTKSVDDSEGEDSIDLELDDLERLPDSPDSVNRSIVVARPGPGMDMDLSRPGPMLDPRIFGAREPPLRIYYPYFKKFIEEGEREMQEMKAQEASFEQSGATSSVSGGAKASAVVLPVPPLPSRKSL